MAATGSRRWQHPAAPFLVVLTCFAHGCHHSAPPEPWVAAPGLGSPQPPAIAGGVPNPLTVQGVNPEFLWEQLADMTDDYFSIASEQRVQNLGGLLTEGKIETRYLPGATYLEPWQLDSSSTEERLLATLQSIRRRATIRVVPTNGAFQVHLVVDRDLEDVDQSASSLPGSSVPRHDGSLMRMLDTPEKGPQTLGWIPLGRDYALEQEMLRELNSRIAENPL